MSKTKQTNDGRKRIQLGDWQESSRRDCTEDNRTKRSWLGQLTVWAILGVGFALATANALMCGKEVW